MRISRWDQSECQPDQELLPDWALEQLGEFATKHNNSTSLVEVGMGFDFWFLPKDTVLGMFEKLRQKGLRLVTAHCGRNAFMGELPNSVSCLPLTQIDARSPFAGPDVPLIRSSASTIPTVGFHTAHAFPTPFAL